MATPTARTEHAVAAVVYNPVKVDAAELREAIEREESASDWTTLWFETTEAEPGRAQAEQALAAGATLVIAAGGDGTVREVAEGLKGTHAALGLLPSGTGNLLARNLDLTLDDLGHSLHTAFAGTDRLVDVGIMRIGRPGGGTDDHAFLVMGGVGLDAKIMANTDPELKRKVGWLAYAKALFATLRDHEGLRLRYRVGDARSHSTRAEAVIVGNCGSLPANILLLPDAVVDDGLLDIVVLKPESVRGWIQVWFKIFWENGIVKRTRLGRKLEGVNVAAVDYRQAPGIQVRLSRPEEVELDGDTFGQAIAFDVRVEPRALRIRVPA